MSVEIKEVLSKIDLKKWVDFPNKLYKGVDSYVPFLFSDEMSTFNLKSNPAYEYCETRLFLAYRDGKIVGRIGGLINNAYNEKWNKNAIRFTRFDFIDDMEVSKALFDTVVDWGKEHGFTTIHGPIGFHDMDHEGMLVEGFDELNMFITFYNHPYYIKHMEALGLVKDVDWVEYQVMIPDKVGERLERIANHLIKRNGFELITYTDNKVLKKDAYEAFKVIDVAFSKLYGTVPLTDAVIDKAICDYIPIVNKKYVCTIKDKDGAIVAFAMMLPSMAKALKKSNGKLFPFGVFRVLKALNGHNDVLDMMLVAVKPEYQKLGLPGIIMNQMIKVCVENGVKHCETGPELELNGDVQSMWKSFNTRQHKRRRCWTKEI